MKPFLLRLLMLGIVVALVLWWSPELRNDADKLLRDTGLRSTSVTLYKWRDKQGVWQYTQDPPPAGVPYEEVEARSDVNVLPLPEQLKTDN
ncbi:MAG: DUF4124 domain-containing protein [Gammaproteobacteria bacterium]|nr:MAG: DUF4124 domain-containing protein [Gammaproteobacteria bacterium]